MNKKKTVDIYKNRIDVIQLSIDKTAEFIKLVDNNNNLPSFITHIMLENMFYEYDENLKIYIYEDDIESGGYDYVRHNGVKYGKEYAYYKATPENVAIEFSHFLSYNLLDDGELSIIDDNLSHPKYDSDDYWDDNVTDIGIALWLLEKLGIIIPCECISSITNASVFESVCFSEYVKDFQNYLKVNELDPLYARIDMYSKTGRLSLRIVAKIPYNG